MAGSRDCIDALARAVGRQLTDEEADAIFSRLHKAALDIKAGRASPQDVELGRPRGTAQLRADLAAGGTAGQADDLIRMAADRAAQDLQWEAAKAAQRAHLQIAKLGSRVADAQRLEAANVEPLKAIDFMIARDFSGRVNVESLEAKVTGYESMYLSRLMDTWAGLGNDFLGFWQDRLKLVDLMKELHGERTGNALARAGAQAYLAVAEHARQAFNAAGGSIGHLDDWGNPQHHSQERVAKAGKDAWVDQIMPYLNRAKYANEFDGTPFTDAQMREFLGHAWETIATNGNNKVVPGQPRGFGSRAARHAEHRQIHFRDAESQIAYWEAFGERTAVEILSGHVKTMARDVAFVEHFGPNPNLTYQTLRDAALQRATLADPVHTPRLEAEAVRLDNLYDYAAGRRKPTFRVWLKKTADAIANANVAGKLGSSAITSFFGDKVMLEAVSHLNNLPIMQRWANELAMLSPTNAAERRLLQRQGLMLDSVRSGLQRFGDDLAQSGVSGRIANAVMRITGMQAINDLRKGAFGATLMDAIGHELQRGVRFDQLADSDIRVLRNYGITEADWRTWGLARLDDMGRNHTMLTPENISRISDGDLIQAGVISQTASAAEAEAARSSAIVKLLGSINSESEFAIVTPGWRERALFHGAVQRGTVPGEIWRSILQFKSFPWAFFQRGMDAVANKDGPMSKAGMAAYILMATTVAGAMTMQSKEILAGKDPRKMMDENWYKFWGAAFIYGGALGFYGDFLYSVNQTRYGSGPIEALSGPTLGPLLELALVQPLTAARKAIEGDETHLGAQTLFDLKGFVPMANAWYTKAAVDHLVWNQVLDALSPGYLNNIRRRTLREYDQEWWWDVGDRAPSRAPNLGAAIQ